MLQGPILAAVYAVKEMQEVGEELAFNVAFVFEGEEENGSKVMLAWQRMLVYTLI